MNYTIGLPILLAVILLLWWLWYIERKWLRLFPERVRSWMDREGLTQEDAAEVIGNYLGGEDNKFDVRTLRRWMSGEGPNPMTVLRMQRLLNGTSYLQAEQTLDNGTKSYAVLLKRDEVSDAEIDRLVQESQARRSAKGQNATKQHPKRRHSR